MRCTYDLTESEIIFIKTHLIKEPAEYVVTISYPMDNITPPKYEIEPRMIYNENNLIIKGIDNMVDEEVR